MADPLKYFRVEAREILEQLQSGLLELERGQAQAECVARLLRLAHTLKGAARVVKQLEIAKLSHQVEELLLPLRGAERAPSPLEVESLLGALDAIAACVAALTALPDAAAPGAAQGQRAPAPAAPDEARHDLAAPLDHVEGLMDGVTELGFQLGAARRALAGLTHGLRLAEQLADRLDPRRAAATTPGGAATLRGYAGELEGRLSQLQVELTASLERATRELGQVRDRVDQLRLVAVGSMFVTLERAARDAAVSLGKQAVFEARGGEVRLDADVLGAVQRALVQGVRNAIAHGIEPSGERTRRGKPPQGSVVLEVARRGKRVSFVCRDDGQGVDLARVRREAERLGRVPPSAETSSPEELLSLLLRGGISTSPVVDQVAGRGVGLDLIREALSSVGGTVALRTEPGAGTSLELSVPASLTALDALIVEAGGEICAIPLGAVARAMRLGASELHHAAHRASLIFEDQAVDFVPLANLLRAGAGAERVDRPWPAVIVRGRAGLLALGVERLLGSESVVARALPDSVEVDATVAGVTLDSDGNPRLLLDPDGLLAAAARAPLSLPAAPTRRRTILVVDDSLTTRMLEQSILESAGYDVELAVSAEQGLEMARAGSYDLFLVDVEMPGMDGFGFVEQIRADPRLGATPVVLVTSRASPADLARGSAAGASGHIAKGEFDQVAFLEQIDGLMR